MTWTAPVIPATGTLVTAAFWNQQITNNLTYLGNSHAHFGAAGDGATLIMLRDISGLIGMFDAACPSGWTRVSAFDGKFLVGSATYGTTGGSDSHSHTDATGHAHSLAHTHEAGTFASWGLSPGAEQSYSGANTGTSIDHTHTASGASAAGTGGNSQVALASNDGKPTYIEVIFCKKD